jgi:hypothetical protein
MSPPYPSPAQIPNKKRSSTLEVNGPPGKRRKASNVSNASTRLRQTSFPPENVGSPFTARSPSVDAVSHVSGSAVSTTASGAPVKKKRGRKAKNAKGGAGDESKEQTPSLVGGKAPTTVSGQGGDKDLEDDEDDDKAEMALEDVTARTQEQKQEEVRLRAMLVEAFDSEQYDRYELWRAAKLSESVVKRVSFLASMEESTLTMNRSSTLQSPSPSQEWSAQPSEPSPSSSLERSSNKHALCRPSGLKQARCRPMYRHHRHHRRRTERRRREGPRNSR